MLDLAPTPLTRPERRLQALARVAVALLCVLFPLLFHFWRNDPRGQLDPAGYDQAQAARYLATRGRFGTRVIRPLEAHSLKAYADGALPDLGHPPLYTAVAAAALRGAHQDGPGQGDRVLALLGCLLLLCGGGATLILHRELFGARGLCRAVMLFTFSAGAMTAALAPASATLAALLAGLLFWALAALDSDRRSAPARAGLAALAGALWGLLFLSLYSALVFLPFLTVYVWIASGRRPPALASFLLAALAFAALQGALAWKATGNPFYHTPLYSLLAQTPTFPGERLYHLGGLPRSVPQYLAAGGLGEILGKTARHLGGYLLELLMRLGPVQVFLLLGAGLIRFTDPRANRLRLLAWMLLGAHLLGLSLFLPPAQGGGALLVHAPLTAALGASFLEVVVRARRLPQIQTRAALIGWTALACLPGVARIVGAPAPAERPEALLDWLETSGELERWRRVGKGILLSESAPEMAYRLDASVGLLPVNTAEFARLERHLRRPVDGIVLTPAALSGGEDPSIPSAWRVTAQTVVGFWSVVLALPRAERSAFTEQFRAEYPGALSLALSDFKPMPLTERGGRYSILFWHPRIIAGR